MAKSIKGAKDVEAEITEELGARLDRSARLNRAPVPQNLRHKGSKGVEIDWSNISDIERLIFEERQARASIGQGTSPQTHQDWWRTVADLLGYLRRQKAWRVSESQQDALIEVITVIEAQARYLGRGIVPRPISAVVPPHAPPIGPAEEKDIRIAVHFIRCADAKTIHARKKARKTISRLYGVAPPTVRRWLKDYPDEESSPCDQLRRLVMKAGERYRSNSSRTLQSRTPKTVRRGSLCKDER